MADQPTTKNEASVEDRWVAQFLDYLGLGFILTAIEVLVREGGIVSAFLLCVIGGGLLAAGLNWQRLKAKLPAQTVASLRTVASDARSWLMLLLILWLYFVVPTVIQRVKEGHVVSEQFRLLRADLDCYVMPRLLTREQARNVSEYLLAHESHAIMVNVLRTDGEVSNYGAQIFNALKAGGWDATINYVDSLSRDGVTTERRGGKQQEDPKHPSGETLLRTAFGQILTGGGGSSGGKDEPESLTLFVGRKPFRANCADWMW